MIDAAGWSVPSMVYEFGAAEIYLIHRRADLVTVEGWSVAGTCVLQRRFVTDEPTLLRSGVDQSFREDRTIASRTF